MKLVKSLNKLIISGFYNRNMNGVRICSIRLIVLFLFDNEVFEKVFRKL